jgi:hypothetical protein
MSGSASEQEPSAERQTCAAIDPDQANTRSPARGRKTRAFLLTKTYMDGGDSPGTLEFKKCSREVDFSLQTFERSQTADLRQSRNSAFSKSFRRVHGLATRDESSQAISLPRPGRRVDSLQVRDESFNCLRNSKHRLIAFRTPIRMPPSAGRLDARTGLVVSFHGLEKIEA